jgi:hypothetical protein
MQNRRNFIKKASLAASTVLAASGAQAAAKPKKPKKQLLHHVFFWLKNPDSTADVAKLIEGLNTLRAIPTINRLHIGTLASTEKRDVVDTSWQVSELMFFDNEAGQKVYQDHPLHQAFVKNYSHLWAKVIVYDAKDA